jgi:hypothetical protein
MMAIVLGHFVSHLSLDKTDLYDKQRYLLYARLIPSGGGDVKRRVKERAFPVGAAVLDSITMQKFYASCAINCTHGEIETFLCWELRFIIVWDE